MEVAWKNLLAYMTGSVNQERLLRNSYLVTETRFLYKQMQDHVQLSDVERKILAEIVKQLGFPDPRAWENDDLEGAHPHAYGCAGGDGFFHHRSVDG